MPRRAIKKNYMTNNQLKSKCCNKDVVLSGDRYFCGGTDGCGNWCETVEEPMTNNQPAWEREFDEQIVGEICDDNPCNYGLIKDFISSLLAKQQDTPMGISAWTAHGRKHGYLDYAKDMMRIDIEREWKENLGKMIEQILALITEEIAIAHTKDTGGKTSRLTSLYMRISKIK